MIIARWHQYPGFKTSPQKVKRLHYWVSEADQEQFQFLKDCTGLRELRIQGETKVYDAPTMAIPREILHLPRLKKLTLLNLPISELPPWFAQLQKLRFLMLRGLDLQSISPILDQLKSLRVLHLENIPITELNCSLRTLTKLKHLSFVDSQVRSLPTDYLPSSLKKVRLGPPNQFLIKNKGVWQKIQI